MTVSNESIIKLAQQGSKFQAFDQAIEYYLEPNIPDYQREHVRKKIIFQTLLFIAGYQLDELEEKKHIADDCLEMLERDHAGAENTALVSCLFRLLAETRIDWVEEPRWRGAIADFIRRNDDESVLTREWKIDLHRMGNVAIQDLRKVVRGTQEEFLKALDITSLDRASAQKHVMMRVLNRASGKAMLQPFFASRTVAELNELYARLDTYIEQRNSWSVLDAYENVRQQLNLFIDLTNAYNTLYSKLLYEKIGQRLLDLLACDFKLNKAAQPAYVNVEPRDKKYPLHTINTKTSIAVVVHNEGPGYANEVQLEVVTDKPLVIIDGGDKIALGRLTPSVQQNIDIEVTVIEPCLSVAAIVVINWKNFDGSEREQQFDFILESQRSDTDWDALAQSEPYSLSPVTTGDKLVGRKDILNRLVGIFQAQQIGSAIIKGQKRVGKTSVAQAFAEGLREKGYIVLYLEGGSYVDPNPEKTVAQLGMRLCRQLRQYDQRLRHLPIPEFTNSLLPLVDFIDDIETVITDVKVVFILDEFDELPVDLYRRNQLGNAFFLNLRSLSGRRNVGFLLVGSEKMNRILDYQGSQVNKWHTIAVDYFRRDKDWADFRELIERPVKNSIDYNENALNRLHEVTSGNPYFTNLVCDFIFRNAAEKRDCYVTVDEVEYAITTSAEELSANTFQHFWDDGIIETEENITEKSIRRRKVLIAVADTIERDGVGKIETICQHTSIRNIPSARSELEEFLNRDVLLHDHSNDSVSFKVQLFEKWLRAKGMKDLIASFSVLDASLRDLEEEERQRVESGAIIQLVERWGLYKGQKITADHIRSWLGQFGRPRNQRLMFRILEGLRFYSDSATREKMKDIERIVRRITINRIEAGKRKRSDVLISYLDKVGKSGAHMAYLYADVTQVYIGNVVEKTQLEKRLADDKAIQAVVFIDDFVGTGNSVNTYLKDIDEQISSIHQLNPELKIVFAAIVAFDEGWASIQRHINSLNLDIEIHACEILRKSDQCFSEESSIFPDATEREDARNIALELGNKLEKRWPLGYGYLELALVFEHTCPNNSLPILYSSSSGACEWRPLFKRH